ncbi:hypothetical protein AJ78_08505 [Emergomyces pasteurianus Ep9510]|uniref:Uncharacterized protein n=1 Tax=Emergomyces pasteurianus Ep9510 TaxID=1447872 RepID=A0A1J9P125_9EURO|nr:hypothetical protein AJ78_08505 [Emergomyces pasteurianus Ep9510]
MKITTIFTSFILSLSVYNVVSEPVSITKRLLSDYLFTLHNIRTGFKSWSEAFPAADRINLIARGYDVYYACVEGIEMIEPEDPLDHEDTLSLIKGILIVVDVSESTVSSLILIKDKVKALDVTAPLEDLLKKQQSCFYRYSKLLETKVVPSLGSLVEFLASRLGTAIQDGIEAFNTTAPPNSTRIFTPSSLTST